MNNRPISPKVLIIDDKPENLALFRDILAPYNYDLSVSTNGPTALEIIKEFHPELILLDVVMPGMDGYEVLSRLKQKRSTKDIPVIFLTAKDSTEDIVKGFEAGVVDYIAKPFHPKELIARVETHLQKARLFANLKNLMEYSFHELYTPLSIISSSMQIQELEHEKTQYTQMTLAACRTLQNIYDDLYYSISFTSKTREKTLFDLCELINERVDYFSLAAENRSLSFQTELPEKMLINISRQDIERVLDNLLSNSLKYTKENNEITVSLKKEKEKWHFCICNPTSKEVDADKVFNKYYRQEEEVFGVGLGLNLVQSICKDNDINIYADFKNNIFCMHIELKED